MRLPREIVNYILEIRRSQQWKERLVILHRLLDECVPIISIKYRAYGAVHHCLFGHVKLAILKVYEDHQEDIHYEQLYLINDDDFTPTYRDLEIHS